MYCKLGIPRTLTICPLNPLVGKTLALHRLRTWVHLLQLPMHAYCAGCILLSPMEKLQVTLNTKQVRASRGIDGDFLAFFILVDFLLQQFLLSLLSTTSEFIHAYAHSNHPYCVKQNHTPQLEWFSRRSKETTQATSYQSSNNMRSAHSLGRKWVAYTLGSFLLYSISYIPTSSSRRGY